MTVLADAVDQEDHGHSRGVPTRQSGGSWHDHYGDRKQMLVFIGQDMDEAAIRGMLDDCLLASPLAEAEFAQWEGRENPFPLLSFPMKKRQKTNRDLFNLRVRFQEWSRHLVPLETHQTCDTPVMREAKATSTSISRCSEVETTPQNLVSVQAQKSICRGPIKNEEKDQCWNENDHTCSPSYTKR